MIEEITPKDLLESSFFILDVRTPEETLRYSLEGSLLLPLNELFVRLNEVPKEERVVVVCRSGSRSAFASSLLREKGVNAVNLVGGLKALTLQRLEDGELNKMQASRILQLIG